MIGTELPRRNQGTGCLGRIPAEGLDRPMAMKQNLPLRGKGIEMREMAISTGELELLRMSVAALKISPSIWWNKVTGSGWGRTYLPPSASEP